MVDYGIDVSGYNTITDWTKVRDAGNSWAWAKATQGSGYVNPLFASQMAGGQAAGLAMGAYHFPDPRVSVATNVNHFVSVARSAGAFEDGAFLPMLDMENSTTEGITWSAAGANGFISAFRDALRTATGQRLLCVYASESWWADGFLNPAAWADSGVFLCAAQYSGIPGQLSWSHPRLAVHQYTDTAPTPGATGMTDRSVTVGGWTLADLTTGGDMALDPNDPVVQQLLAGANSVQFGKAGIRSAGDLALAVYNLQQDIAAVKATVGQQVTPTVTLDPAAVAQALAQLEGPQIVSAVQAALQALPGELATQLVAEFKAILDKAAG